MRFLRDKLRDKLFEDGTSCPIKQLLRDKWDKVKIACPVVCPVRGWAQSPILTCFFLLMGQMGQMGQEIL